MLQANLKVDSSLVSSMLARLGVNLDLQTAEQVAVSLTRTLPLAVSTAALLSRSVEPLQFVVPLAPEETEDV